MLIVAADDEELVFGGTSGTSLLAIDDVVLAPPAFRSDLILVAAEDKELVSGCRLSRLLFAADDVTLVAVCKSGTLSLSAVKEELITGCTLDMLLHAADDEEPVPICRSEMLLSACVDEEAVPEGQEECNSSSSVTSDGRNSSASKISGLQGHRPVLANPVTAFFTVAIVV